MSTRFPIARCTSIRCRPHSDSTWTLTTASPTMSLVRGPAGSPCTVTARYDPPGFETHSAVSSPGTLTNGVSTSFAGVTHGPGSFDAVLTMLPFADRYDCSSPLPPPSAAGFVQPETIPSPGPLRKRRLSCGGTFAWKEAYVL